MPVLTPLRTAALRRSTQHHHHGPLPPRHLRPLHASAAARRPPPPPYKDDMDRESLKPQRHENTGSGTDDQVARNPDAAFNPRKTSPEAARDAAGKSPHGNGGSPLEVSGANREAAEAGRGHAEDRVPKAKGAPSKSGSPTKGGTLNNEKKGADGKKAKTKA